MTDDTVPPPPTGPRKRPPPKSGRHSGRRRVPPPPVRSSESTIDLKALRSALRDPKRSTLSGRRFERYEVLGEIARGGMGIVLRARHKELGSKVALKLLAHEDPSPEAVARFRREARVLAQIKHPHVVGISDLGEEGGIAFLVMELIEGETLHTWVEKEKAAGRQPDLERAIAITLEVGKALLYCHELGAIHRDVKPANILIEAETGRSVLTDFGLVKRSRGGTGASGAISQTGSVVGTPSFMSPEQFEPEGDFGSVGAKTDVWALVSVLFYTLTGQPPFPSKNVVDLYGQVIGEPAPKLSNVREGAPLALEELIEACLVKQVRDRLSMAELIAGLERLQANPSLLEPPRPHGGARYAIGLILIFFVLAIVHLVWIQPEQGRRLMSLLDKQDPVSPAPKDPLEELKERAKTDPAALRELAERTLSDGKVKEAAELYRQAAEQGDFDAMYSYGSMLAAGRGVERDERSGYEWLLKVATEQGNHTPATILLSRMIAEGRGVQANPQLALKWLDRALEKAENKAFRRNVNSEREELLKAHPELKR